MKGRYPLSSTIEHAVETLGPDFEFEDERRFTLSVSTSFLPADCLDALGIPEAQPLKLHFRFSGSHICADLLPSVEVTYCEHGRTRQMHQQNRPAQATPHDKFLHQVRSSNTSKREVALTTGVGGSILVCWLQVYMCLELCLGIPPIHPRLSPALSSLPA